MLSEIPTNMLLITILSSKGARRGGAEISSCLGRLSSLQPGALAAQLYKHKPQNKHSVTKENSKHSYTILAQKHVPGRDRKGLVCDHMKARDQQGDNSKEGCLLTQGHVHIKA